MNPGEIWRTDDGHRRLVVSHPTYNASSLGRVITCVVGEVSSRGELDPFAVETHLGDYVFCDRIMMHPRPWLVQPVTRLDENIYQAVVTHLRFLITPPRL